MCLLLASAVSGGAEGSASPATLGAESYVAPPASVAVDDLASLTKVSLRYTYRNDRGQVGVLRDPSGKPYLPLREVAEFFGVRLDYQPQNQRLSLARGQRKVVAVLSRSLALVDGNELLVLSPPEMVEGRLAMEPEAAAELFRSVLNVQVLFLREHAVLSVGGVTPDDVRREIAAEATGKGARPPGVSATPPPPPPQATLPPESSGRVATISSQPRRFYQVRRVVLDAGHGGRDGGAVGHSKKFNEKEANLDIALRVADLLRQEPDLEVLMTREKDRFISLQDRVEFANRHKADLFVSIHCNANRRKNARGTETYVYSSRATGSAAEAAARENGGGDTLDFVLDDLVHGAYRLRSYFLAEKIDQRIRDRLSQKILRIEQAPFYVLARVRMPSVLVETAFITNKEEEKKLKDPEWRQRISQAIADGILAYRDGVEDSLERR